MDSLHHTLRKHGWILPGRDCVNMAGFSLSETAGTGLDSLYHRLRKHGWILSFRDCENRAGFSLSQTA
jgi:hypothetical protein